MGGGEEEDVYILFICCKGFTVVGMFGFSRRVVFGEAGSCCLFCGWFVGPGRIAEYGRG